MTTTSNETASRGISFGGLLFLLFLTLKLCGVIDWSWWWVTAPLWVIPSVILFAFACLMLVVSIDSMVRVKR